MMLALVVLLAPSASACGKKNKQDMKKTIVSKSDFSHSVSSGSKRITTAVYSDGHVYARTAQEQGFAIISTETGEVVSRFSDTRLQAGLLAGRERDVYAPIYHKLFKVNETSSTKLLAEYAEDMFGVIDVHVSDPYLFVRAHNGMYVYDLATSAQLAAFKNNNTNTVSTVNFYFNAKSGILYVAGLRDQKNEHSIVLRADAEENFKVVWKVHLDGDLSASADEPGINKIYETDAYLLCAVGKFDRSSAHIAYLDKTSGELRHKVETQFSGDVVYTPERIYLKHYREYQTAAIDIETREVLWTSDLDPGQSYGLTLFRDNLYVYRADKRTRVISTADGSSIVREGALGIEPVYGEDLRVSDRYFAVDGHICWD